MEKITSTKASKLTVVERERFIWLSLYVTFMQPVPKMDWVCFIPFKALDFGSLWRGILGLKTHLPCTTSFSAANFNSEYHIKTHGATPVIRDIGVYLSQKRAEQAP